MPHHAGPTVVEKSIKGMRAKIRNARLWGSDTVLLGLIHMVAELKVIAGVGGVGNKFPLSPLAFAGDD